MQDDPSQAAAESIRNTCIEAALRAYEDAGISGLCAEGRWECAAGALRTVSLDAPLSPERSGSASTHASLIGNFGAVNTIIYCTAWQETVAFYQERLGLLVTFSNDWFVEFKLNEAARLSIADAARASMGSRNGEGLTISIEVDDVAATHAALLQAALQPTEIKDCRGQQTTFIRDPSQNRIEFWSRGTASG